MTNTETRTRVTRGIPTGGQFAAESHAEAPGITLTAETSELDTAAVKAVGDKCRSAVISEIDRWQRRMDRRGANELPPLATELADAQDRANNFETLERKDQLELMQKLQLTDLNHLLEPGQQLGTDRVPLSDDFEPAPEDFGIGLIAQKRMAETNLPSGFVFSKLETGEATFTRTKDGVTSAIAFGDRSTQFAAEGAEMEADGFPNFEMDEWLRRAEIGSYGVGTSDRLETLWNQHQETAVMSSVIGASSFRFDGEHLGEFDREARTVELRDQDTECLLDLSGDEPFIAGHRAVPLHPAMTRGFLDHMASETRRSSGDEFTNDLLEIFREADRRMVR